APDGGFAATVAAARHGKVKARRRDIGWVGRARGARLRWGIRHPAGELDWGKRHMIRPTCAALAAALGLALGSGPALAADTSPFAHDPYPSTYERIAAPPVLITGATVLDGAGNRIDDADVLMADGVIVEVGRGLQAPAGATRVDGTGKWVTPGIIDVHSHLGVYPSPGVRAHSDGNEAVAPNTAHVWAEHSVWPQDPGFGAALAGGVTS